MDCKASSQSPKSGVTITAIDVQQLTQAEVHHLSKLTLGDRGQMRNDLQTCRAVNNKHPKEFRNKSYAVVARNASGKIIGWSLLFNQSLSYVLSAPNAGLRAIRYKYNYSGVRYATRWTAHFFVDPSCRKQGIGTALYEAVIEIKKLFYVYKWTDQSTKFFRKNERIIKSKTKARFLSRMPQSSERAVPTCGWQDDSCVV